MKKEDGTLGSSFGDAWMDSMETPHACVQTGSKLNKHIPVSCIPIEDLRTRSTSKIAVAKKADILVTFRPSRYEGAAMRCFERNNSLGCNAALTYLIFFLAQAMKLPDDHSDGTRVRVHTCHLFVSYVNHVQ